MKIALIENDFLKDSMAVTISLQNRFAQYFVVKVG